MFIIITKCKYINNENSDNKRSDNKYNDNKRNDKINFKSLLHVN